MSCDSTTSTYLALRSVLFWPLQLLGTGALKLTTLLLALHSASLQARMHQGSLQPTNSFRSSPPDYTEDLNAELLGPETDLWYDYLDDPFVQSTCIHHLQRCYRLDCSRHSHP